MDVLSDDLIYLLGDLPMSREGELALVCGGGRGWYFVFVLCEGELALHRCVLFARTPCYISLVPIHSSQRRHRTQTRLLKFWILTTRGLIAKELAPYAPVSFNHPRTLRNSSASRLIFCVNHLMKSLSSFSHTERRSCLESLRHYDP